MDSFVHDGTFLFAGLFLLSLSLGTKIDFRNREARKINLHRYHKHQISGIIKQDKGAMKISGDSFIRKKRSRIGLHLCLLLLLFTFRQRIRRYVHVQKSSPAATLVVSAYLYINGKQYPLRRAAFGKYIEEHESFRIRMQYFPHNPSLCGNNTVKIPVVDYSMNTQINATFAPKNITTGNKTAVPTSQFITPLPIHYNETTFVKNNISAGLLVVRNRDRNDCSPLRQALKAQAIHSSITVLFVSSDTPYYNNIEELFIYDREEYKYTRLFVLSISNRTGKILQKYINDASEYVRERGGPVVHFDTKGSYVWDLQPTRAPSQPMTIPYQHPTDNTRKWSTDQIIGVSVFVSIAAAICVIATIVKSPYGANNNRSTGIVTANRSLVTETVIISTANPSASQNIRRLLTKDEAQLFITNFSHDGTHSEEIIDLTLQQLPSETATAINAEAEVSTINRITSRFELCVICLLELSPSDNNCTNQTNENDSETSPKIARLPCCHVFHMKCIVPWLTENQANCPLCKYDVLKYMTDQTHA